MVPGRSVGRPIGRAQFAPAPELGGKPANKADQVEESGSEADAAPEYACLTLTPGFGALVEASRLAPGRAVAEELRRKGFSPGARG